MEKNLTVTVTTTATNEECVTPRDPGSRIPPATVCPPAPRKRPAVFYTTDLSPTDERPSSKLDRRVSKVAIQLLFDVEDCATSTKKKKKMMEDDHDETPDCLPAESDTDTPHNDASDC